MKLAPLAAILAGIAISAAPAHAHDDAHLATVKTANGGQLRQAGPYHYELVTARDGTDAKESPVVVYVTDDGGKKVSTVGASGTATILSGKVKTTAALVPDGDNRMKGAARYAPAPGMKVVVSVALPGKQPEQARFTPLDAAKDAHGKVSK
jgi:hypothetical protein